jgi:hypothetical protein
MDNGGACAFLHHPVCCEQSRHQFREVGRFRALEIFSFRLQ